MFIDEAKGDIIGLRDRLDKMGKSEGDNKQGIENLEVRMQNLRNLAMSQPTGGMPIDANGD